MAVPYQDLFLKAPIGMCRVGPNGRFHEVNERLCEIFRRSRDDLMACSYQDLTHPSDLARDEAQLERLLERGHGGYSMLKRYLRPDGSHFWAQLDVNLVTDAAGAPDYFISVIQPMDHGGGSTDGLHERASTDHLTGLSNRYALEEALEMFERRAKRRAEPFAMVLFDLDDFKEINDGLGHLAGDEALRMIAQRMQDIAQPGEVVARYGGDEFIVLLPNVSSRGQLGLRLIAYLGAFDRPMTLRGKRRRVGASVGHAIFPDDADTIKAAIDLADRRMLEVKRSRQDAGRR